MKIESTAKWIGSIVSIAALIWLAPAQGHAQSLAELNTSMAIQGELDSGQVSSPAGMNALDRARNASGANNARPTTNPSPTTPGIPVANNQPPAMPNAPIPPMLNAILPNARRSQSTARASLMRSPARYSKMRSKSR